jgi:hypothetical protein
MRPPDDARPDRPSVLFSDLMSKVGYFLFYWSNLEKALIDAIREDRSGTGRPSDRVVGSFSERLNLWRELTTQLPVNENRAQLVDQIARQALSLRDIRNTIVHGLMGGNSIPNTGPGHIQCALGGYDKPTGEIVRYSMEDLEHITKAVDACRRGFRDVDSLNYLLDPRFQKDAGF